jgi:hypothetical protein
MGCTPLERVPLKSQNLATISACLLLITTVVSPALAADSMILVVGAPGEEQFLTNFVEQASSWEKACARAGISPAIVGSPASARTNDFDVLKESLAAEPKDGNGRLWLVLIGHGTFDGKTAKFNLRGPDVTAADLALWLKPFSRPLVVVDTTSCSAPFINTLSATNRAVVTATRSGYEENFTHFGHFLAEALWNSEADLDKDHQVSLLEAFLTAARQTAEFYKTEGRIATEHALLDDNGDGMGTPAEWFRGVRAVKRPKEKAGADGLLASQICLVPGTLEQHWTVEQRARRDALERAVLKHREKRNEMPEAEYYRQLEELLLPLAQFYASNTLAKPIEATAK